MSIDYVVFAALPIVPLFDVIHHYRNNKSAVLIHVRYFQEKTISLKSMIYKTKLNCGMLSIIHKRAL